MTSFVFMCVIIIINALEWWGLALCGLKKYIFHLNHVCLKKRSFYLSHYIWQSGYWPNTKQRLPAPLHFEVPPRPRDEIQEDLT